MFLRLSNVLLNIHKISKIEIYPNSYYLHFENYSSYGSLFFSFGSFSGSNETCYIEKEKNPDDFETIRRWIDKYSPPNP